MMDYPSKRKDDTWLRIISNCHVSEDPDTFFEGTPCWEWQGTTSGEGRGGHYGRISIDGFTSAVHRVVYMLVHGYVHPKRQIDHRCENRICCNPLHLEDVTHKTNQRRRRKK